MAGFDYNRGNTATSTQINPSKGYSEKAAIVYSVITELDEIPNVEKSINTFLQFRAKISRYCTFSVYCT